MIYIFFVSKQGIFTRSKYISRVSFDLDNALDLDLR